MPPVTRRNSRGSTQIEAIDLTKDPVKVSAKSTQRTTRKRQALGDISNRTGDGPGPQQPKKQKSGPTTRSASRAAASGGAKKKQPQRTTTRRKSSSADVPPPPPQASIAPPSAPSTSRQATSVSLSVASSVVRDIDEVQGKDPLYEKTYVQDIFERHREDEVTFQAVPTYIPNPQNDINYTMRSILIDWLVEVAEELNLRTQTLYISVNLIDRSLMKFMIPRNRLQLLGCACMWIAAKYEEVDPISVDEFVTMSDHTYARHQIIDMELRVLNALNFQFSGATSHIFLDRFLCASRSGRREQSLARYLSELSLLNYRPMMNYLPSMIAAGCIHLSRQMLGMSVVWDATMAHYSGYDASQLYNVVHDLRDVLEAGPPQNLQAVKDKYAHEKFHEVSSLTPPTRHSLRF